MAVEHGDRFLSQSWQMKDVFEQANMNHRATIIRNQESGAQHDMSGIMSSYVYAGFAWLANRSNSPYLQEIGTTAWHMCSQNYVGLRAFYDIEPAAQRGLIDPNSLPFVDPTWPHFRYGFETDKTGIIEYEAAEVLLPYNLLQQALSNPIDTLAKLAHTASRINDIAIGRYDTFDIEMSLRATATYAEILGRGTRLYPELVLTDKQQEILEHFPNGFETMKKNMRGRGMNGNQIPNYWRN